MDEQANERRAQRRREARRHSAPARDEEHRKPEGIPGHGHIDYPPPEGVEPDFTENEGLGTTNPQEAVEQAEPYFPPTDPVIRPASNAEEGAEVVGGFQATSMDELGVEGEETTGEYEQGLLPGDEQVASVVGRELSEDAMTADLHIAVDVRDGVVRLRGSVPSLQDAEAAVEVAARVEGVAEVLDELEIEGLAAR